MKNLLIFLLIFPFAFGQNLVPNFSFEEYTDCPTLGDQVDLSIGWSKMNSYTPDYYNACSSPDAAGVPKSFYLYQPDSRTCGAYAGLGTWSRTVANEREVIGVPLNESLVIGQKYYLSFYTVMGGLNDGFYYDTPSNNIGIKLSTISYSPSNPAPIDNFAHLRSIAIISDTTNWVRVSGTIIADSAYNYLMLGNFYDDANTDTITQTCDICINYSSYYLVDDICISTDSLLCNGGIESLACNASISEDSKEDEIMIYPNPFQDNIKISFPKSQNAKLYLYDALGKMILERDIKNKNLFDLSVLSLTNGCYTMKILDESTNKFVINKIIKL